MADQQRLLRKAFAAHRGEEIDTQGDSFFVAFRGAADAVSAAVEIQRALAAHRWPVGAEVRVRIGIHTGEASATDERYLGFSVHRAARIGGAAHGGQVLVSDSTRSLVEDDLPDGIFLRDLGVYRLKDIDRAERISQLAAEGLQVEFPRLRGAELVKPRPSFDADRCSPRRWSELSQPRSQSPCSLWSKIERDVATRPRSSPRSTCARSTSFRLGLATTSTTRSGARSSTRSGSSRQKHPCSARHRDQIQPILLRDRAKRYLVSERLVELTQY